MALGKTISRPRNSSESCLSNTLSYMRRPQMRPAAADGPSLNWLYRDCSRPRPVEQLSTLASGARRSRNTKGAPNGCPEISLAAPFICESGCLIPAAFSGQNSKRSEVVDRYIFHCFLACRSHGGMDGAPQMMKTLSSSIILIPECRSETGGPWATEAVIAQQRRVHLFVARPRYH
jgi:hypothetical protein